MKTPDSRLRLCRGLRRAVPLRAAPRGHGRDRAFRRLPLGRSLRQRDDGHFRPACRRRGPLHLRRTDRLQPHGSRRVRGDVPALRRRISYCPTTTPDPSSGTAGRTCASGSSTSTISWDTRRSTSGTDAPCPTSRSGWEPRCSIPTWPSRRERSTDTRFTSSVAGGLKVFMTPHFGLRFDGRYFGTLLNDHGCNCSHSNWLSNWSTTGGILFAF